MSTTPEKPQTAVDHFWERFIERAREEGVKASAIRWYVLHAEGYLKAAAGKRLAEHSVQDVTGYLQGRGRQGKIPDWRQSRSRSDRDGADRGLLGGYLRVCP